MENVPQIHNKKNIADFNRWQAMLAELGYIIRGLIYEIISIFLKLELEPLW